MPRNYKKETEREKIKYEKFFAKIDKELGKKFKEKLEMPFAVWLKNEIEKYMKGMNTMNFNLKEYTDSVKKFNKDTKDWGNLDNYSHYTSDASDWRETSDNAHGGLDVSWSFHKDITDDDIKENFIKLIKEELECEILGNGIENLNIEIKNLD